jgi:small subunit ribosomal protein S16
LKTNFSATQQGIEGFCFDRAQQTSISRDFQHHFGLTIYLPSITINMVVRLRLQRFGRTHAPFYRMVAANARTPRDGKFLEVVGTYNPIANKHGMKEIRLKEDRLKYWLGVGACTTLDYG